MKTAEECLKEIDDLVSSENVEKLKEKNGNPNDDPFVYAAITGSVRALTEFYFKQKETAHELKRRYGV